MPSKSKAAAKDDRLMTIAELAHYLHLGQRTVLKLVTGKKIPGVLIDKQWRFQRNLIEEWLERQVDSEGEHFEEVPDGMEVPLGDLLPDEAIIVDLRANKPLRAIEELAARAYNNNWLTDKPWFVGAVVERESLASTAMEGGVAFLHTRARDTGKIRRPFVIVGRSYKGVDFGAPDGKPTHLFFLLGLKYDRMHLPILGRLARAMRNPKTIAKLRSMPSKQKMRALLLKEDAEALTTRRSPPIKYVKKAPVLDRKTRLRAIMRLNAQHKHDAAKAEVAERKAAIAAEKAAAALAKKEAAAAKRREISEKKKAAAAKKKAAEKARRDAIREKKAAARAKKKAAAEKKRAAAKNKAEAARNKKKAAAAKKKAAAAKKKAAAAKKKVAATKKKAAAPKKKAAAPKKKAAAPKKKAAAAKKKAAAAKKRSPRTGKGAAKNKPTRKKARKR